MAGTLAGLALFPQLNLWTAAALGGSGFIAAFVAGIVFAALAGEHAQATTPLAEASGELVMLGTSMRRVTVGLLGWFGPRGLPRSCSC